MAYLFRLVLLLGALRVASSLDVADVLAPSVADQEVLAVAPPAELEAQVFHKTQSGACYPGYELAQGDLVNVCAACSPGTFSLGGDHARCRPCPLGSDSDSGASSCVCQPGYYSSSGITTAPACTPCFRGYSSSVGATECQPEPLIQLVDVAEAPSRRPTAEKSGGSERRCKQGDVLCPVDGKLECVDALNTAESCGGCIGADSIVPGPARLRLAQLDFHDEPTESLDYTEKTGWSSVNVTAGLMLPLTVFAQTSCRRSLLAATFLTSRQFSTTRAVFAKKQTSTRRIPSKKAMAAKARRRAAKEAKLVDHSDDMGLEAAIAVLRAAEVSRPRGCFELFVKADLRGSGGGISVPKGRINMPFEPKPRAEDTIMVFAEGRQAEEAKRAGAQIVGGAEMIDGVLSGRLRANTILCTPALIRTITPRLGRFLGPQGLMPAARRGTVTDDVEAYIRRVKNSSEWKSDRLGNIRMPIGRMDFPIENVVKNFRYVMDSIKRVTGNVKLRSEAREENQRKVIPIKKVTLSTRSTPGIPIVDF
ncbi:Mitochondrial 54S ribosomal protein [Mycena chlorophos]|uniref:Mitochondrial 54S ribosomal protein n=1 Tax=Mycena chlorophos TaxID=658473 RepID=A0A8H6W2J2_MYCCL|nr:Mitochondrial 54S ribosomal protein [Mycena chlorophos]